MSDGQVAILVGSVVGSTKRGLEGEAHRDVKLAGHDDAGRGFTSCSTAQEEETRSEGE